MKVAWRQFYGWGVLLSSSLVLMFGFSLTAYSLPVFYPELVQHFHWPRASVAIGGSIQSVLVGWMAPFNGWFIDRRGVKAMLIAGLVLLGTSFGLYSAMHSLWQFYILCFLVGTAGSWVHHLPNELLIAEWFVKRRGLAIGIITTVAGFGAALIPLLTARFIRTLGWQHAFLALPLTLIIPLISTLFMVRNRPQEMGFYPDGAAEPCTTETEACRKVASVPRGPGGDREVLKTAAFWMIAIVFFLDGWATFSVWHHLVFYLRDHGFSPQKAAFLFSFFLATGTLSRFVGGPLADRISAAYTLLLNFIAIAFGLVLLVCTLTSTIAYLSMILFGLGYGGAITCRPLIFFESWGARRIGKVYGVGTAMFTSGAFFGPAVAGYIFDKTASYRLAFLFALALMGGCIALTIAFKRAITKRSALVSAAIVSSVAP